MLATADTGAGVEATGAAVPAGALGVPAAGTADEGDGAASGVALAEAGGGAGAGVARGWPAHAPSTETNPASGRREILARYRIPDA